MKYYLSPTQNQIRNDKFNLVVGAAIGPVSLCNDAI